MTIERLRKIIEYSEKHRDNMHYKIKDFYSYAGMVSGKEVLNIMQIVRPVFQKKGYLIFEIPFADEEIGAFCYKGDALGYIVLNTSLPWYAFNAQIEFSIYVQ